MSKAVKTIRVKQIASPIRRPAYQSECLRALGLGRMHAVRELKDNKIVRGLIKKVHHLVSVEE